MEEEEDEVTELEESVICSCTYLLFTSTLLSLQVFERLVVCWCLDLDFGVLSKGRGDGGVMRAWPLCDGGAAGIL